MADSTASFELLQTVLDLGTHLQEALDTGDMDTLAALVARRGDLLACLQTMPRPLDPPPQWKIMASTVMDQQRTLMQQLQELEGALSETLTSMTRFQHARRRYAEPKAPDHQILHHHVRG